MWFTELREIFLQEKLSFYPSVISQTAFFIDFLWIMEMKTSNAEHIKTFCKKMYYLSVVFVYLLVYFWADPWHRLQDIMKKFDFLMKLHWNCKIYLVYM